LNFNAEEHIMVAWWVVSRLKAVMRLDVNLLVLGLDRQSSR
jgi:hypothetical protein